MTVIYKVEVSLTKMSSPYYIMAVLIIGTLSKSLGQILRVSAAMHILFHLDPEEIDEDSLPQEILEDENEIADGKTLPQEISDQAIEAAIDFVDVCGQHTAYITGRGDITIEVEHFNAGKHEVSVLLYILCG